MLQRPHYQRGFVIGDRGHDAIVSKLVIKLVVSPAPQWHEQIGGPKLPDGILDRPTSAGHLIVA
jgi:hypothetical protein